MGLFDFAEDIVDDVGGGVLDLGKDISGGLFDGAKDAVGGIYDVVKDPISDSFNWLNDNGVFKGVGSVFSEVGGTALGIVKQGTGLVFGVVKMGMGMFQKVFNNMNGILGNLGNLLPYLLLGGGAIALIIVLNK